MSMVKLLQRGIDFSNHPSSPTDVVWEKEQEAEKMNLKVEKLNPSLNLDAR